MSSSSANSRRRLPTNCKCGLPLSKRVSLTDLNPARRFLNCRNSNISNKKKCNDFWWIDPEISSPWYTYQMFKLYVTQTPDERFLYLEHLRAQDHLERLQIEHDGLVSKFEQSKKSCSALLSALCGLWVQDQTTLKPIQWFKGSKR
ncbi:hypothetical protein Tco_0545642 [Tanacetum coccineum]